LAANLERLPLCAPGYFRVTPITSTLTGILRRTQPASFGLLRDTRTKCARETGYSSIAPAEAGVVAEAEIIGNPEPRAEDPDAVPFWRGDSAGTAEVVPRAPLCLLRVAGSPEVLRRDWLREDPVLRELPNLKMPAGTKDRRQNNCSDLPLTEADKTAQIMFRKAQIDSLVLTSVLSCCEFGAHEAGERPAHESVAQQV